MPTGCKETGTATGDFGSQLNQGSQDAYLTKYDSAGNVVWSKLVGSAGSASGYGMALDPAGGVVITGAWIGHQIESSVLQRTAGITALYVDSVVSPNLQALASDDRWLTANDTAALNRLVSDTGLGQDVVLFKIWSLDGRVLYSPDQGLVAQQFPIDMGLARFVDREDDLSQQSSAPRILGTVDYMAPEQALPGNPVDCQLASHSCAVAVRSWSR